MFSFISHSQPKNTTSEKTQLLEDDFKSSEAIQGDAGLIHRINELNELKNFKDNFSKLI